MKNIYVLGSVNMDLVIHTKTMPRQGETLLGSSFMMNPGGKGANQAVAVAKSGGNVKFIGAVGNVFSEELMSALTKYKVDISLLKRISDISSGVALIVMSEGDNRIIVDSGANAKVDFHFVGEALKEAKQGDYLIAQLETPIPTIVSAFALAKERGLITGLNTAPALLLPEEIFPNIDYLCLNETETLFYTGMRPSDKIEAKKAADCLIAKGVKTVVITLGARGAFLLSEEAELYMPSFKVDVIDTTAAGDTFFGAFITRLAFGVTLTEALKFAIAASALCITKSGAQQAIPTEGETINFLRNYHG